MFQKVMKTLQEKKYPIATAAIAYATDDVISKTMGEIVLPNTMKQFGTEVKGSVTFQTQAFDLATQASQLKAQPTDLIGVGAGPEAAVRLAQELRRQGVAGRLVAGSTIGDSELARRMPPDDAVQHTATGSRTACCSTFQIAASVLAAPSCAVSV